MNETLKIRWFYAISITYILFAVYGIYTEKYLVHVLPLLLVFAYLVLFKLESVLLILCFIVPFAIEFDDIGMGMGISIPDEPVVMLIMVLSIIRFVVDGNYDKRVFKHPISIWIVLNIVWYFITISTSEFPFVSLKFSLSRLWFIVVYYFLGVMLFRKINNIYTYLWLYAASLTIVILYTLYSHSLVGFTQETSYYISMPFYRAHGIYSAAIAFFIPFFLVQLFYSYKVKLNIVVVIILFALVSIFVVGVAYSYTRAAWLGILVSLFVSGLVILKISFNKQLLIALSGLVFFYVFQDQILHVLAKNKQDSAEGLERHFQSASNISTDASNTERINRWMSAINMWKERPVVGFGPGTYVFCYAPYQEARYRTKISTNFGNQGNSHSEYLNPLSEAGTFGALSLLVIIYLVLNNALLLFYKTHDYKLKVLLLSVFLAIIGYFVHGLFNHYSETTKIAPLLWGAFAMITAIDIYHKKDESN
ncbi:MAG: O-antigen ligase family protein [Bacteroidia bacterium]|nr:O-antigen ligase family protein [Bacteroidia bacterium]MCC7534011.1 O-antigen ligase family protein [Bacteroidia bacterium]MCZ2141345.1 O-antigen ligase family protein [Bacteroidia bacterium]